MIQERTLSDNEAAMPPPRKVLRRGSHELEAAITEGVVTLSLPQQDWNSWIVNEWFKRDTDESYFESLHHMSDAGETTSSRSSCLPTFEPHHSLDFQNATTSRNDEQTEDHGSTREDMVPAHVDEDYDRHKGPDQSSVTDENSGQATRLPRFSDIIGHNAVKIRLDEVLLPLALPPAITDSILVGVRSLSASILLFGPPGCGKTQLAKAIAGEADAAFLSVGPSDILSKYVGESEAAVRSIFEKAYDQAAHVESRCSVLFFDEIDALGQARGGAHQDQGLQTDPCSRRVLAELLIQLNKINVDNCSYNTRIVTSRNTHGMSVGRNIDHNDNFESDQANQVPSKENKDRIRVIVVAATNRPEDCDPALLRRFSLRVMVSLPNRRDRKKILKKFIADIDHTISSDQLDSLSFKTEGWTGSDLESLTKEAVMAPIRECIRSAALLKRRNSRTKQKGGTSTCQTSDDNGKSTRDTSQERILEQFTNLRPVTVQDFHDAMTFWAYNQGYTDPFSDAEQNTGSISEHTIHYDSSSDEEE